MTKKRYSTKRQRFLEVGEARTNIVLEKLRILGNCANRSLYDYEEEEINKMFKAIQKSVDETKAKFMIHRKERKKRFKFKL